MKITKTQLKQIIKEEISAILKEDFETDAEWRSAMRRQQRQDSRAMAGEARKEKFFNSEEGKKIIQQVMDLKYFAEAVKLGKKYFLDWLPKQKQKVPGLTPKMVRDITYRFFPRYGETKEGLKEVKIEQEPKTMDTLLEELRGLLENWPACEEQPGSPACLYHKQLEKVVLDYGGVGCGPGAHDDPARDEDPIQET